MPAGPAAPAAPEQPVQADSTRSGRRRRAAAHPAESDAARLRRLGRRLRLQGRPVQHRRAGAAAGRRSIRRGRGPRARGCAAGGASPAGAAVRWCCGCRMGRHRRGAQSHVRGARGDRHYHAQLRGRQPHRLAGREPLAGRVGFQHHRPDPAGGAVGGGPHVGMAAGGLRDGGDRRVRLLVHPGAHHRRSRCASARSWGWPTTRF